MDPCPGEGHCDGCDDRVAEAEDQRLHACHTLTPEATNVCTMLIAYAHWSENLRMSCYTTSTASILAITFVQKRCQATSRRFQLRAAVECCGARPL